MVEKVVVIDNIAVDEIGHVMVREATKFVEGGEELGKTYRRYVLNPGDSLADQPEHVSAIARAAWTVNVVNAYRTGRLS